MTQKHKVFISYHHKNDEHYKKSFIESFSNSFEGFISKSVEDGDINPLMQTDTIRQQIRDNFIRDATVTIVLIGTETWKRKHVDWEISSSIRQTQYNSRNGLLGIILPTYNYAFSWNNKNCENGGQYNPYTIPPRLYANIKCGFAKIYKWDTNPFTIQSWIHEAFCKRGIITPDNSYPSFADNRRESQTEWSY
jgi:hypothetical protein